MSSFIIARNLRMNEVTDFNIAYKYFGVLTMAITILLLPFWSAATDAYTRQDFMWLRNKIKQYIKCVLLLNHNRNHHVCLLQGQLYYVWLKERIDISTTLSFLGDVIQYHMCFLSSIRDIAKWYRSNNNTTLCQPYIPASFL